MKLKGIAKNARGSYIYTNNVQNLVEKRKLGCMHERGNIPALGSYLISRSKRKLKECSTLQVLLGVNVAVDA